MGTTNITTRIGRISRLVLLLLAAFVLTSVLATPAMAASGSKWEVADAGIEDGMVDPDQGPETEDIEANTPGAPDHQGAGGLPRRPDNSITDLNEAIVSGVLHPDLEALVATGEDNQVLVSIASADLAVEEHAALDGSDETIAAYVRAASRAFSMRKRALIRAISDGVTLVEDYKHLPSMLVRVDGPGTLLELAKHADVAGLGPNGTGETATAQSLSIIRQPQAASAGHHGAGTIVAVLDTGLNHRHSDFGNCSAGVNTAGCRVVKNLEFATPDNLYDDNGHGTNVAAIVSKVAPGAKLIGMDVFEPGGGAPQSNINRAMSHLIGLRGQGHRIVAANLSIGWPRTLFNMACDGASVQNADPRALNETFRQAWNVGIVTVSAAGNDALAGGRFTEGVGFPACLTYAMKCVGATYDYSGSYSSKSCVDSAAVDKVTCFSQTGMPLNVLAPGAWIQAGGYNMPGTSQAAPHVAGAVAVLAGAKPSARPYDLWTKITSTGRGIRDHRNTSTPIVRNRLDIPAALQALGVTFGGGQRPTVKFIGAVIKPGFRMTTAGQLPVQVTWRGSDDAGIAKYVLFVRKNGGDWIRLQLKSDTVRYDRRLLAAGNTWEFALRAVDTSGNLSAWTYRTVKPLARNENSRFVKTSSGWTRSSSSGAYGGAYMSTKTDNAWAEYSFTGSNVAIIAPTYADGGNLVIYIDGKQVKTVSLNSTNAKHRTVVFSWYWKTSGKHKVTVYADVSSNRPSVSIDAFAVLR